MRDLIQMVNQMKSVPEKMNLNLNISSYFYRNKTIYSQGIIDFTKVCIEKEILVYGYQMKWYARCVVELFKNKSLETQLEKLYNVLGATMLDTDIFELRTMKVD